MSTFPKNTWYVAATSDEIQDKPLGRRICGERIAFYRAQHGMFHIQADYRLMIDNLMDLTHETYVHASCGQTRH
jgi:phenylpropionate dioxygenase-like ring-hydroxylating dioxygenase large terminal subunit